MCGAPQRWFARLIAQMRLRSSAEILGLPTGLRDRSRQYDWNPARCQRMIVSGRIIAIDLRTEGNQRESQTNRKRSVLLSCGRFDTCRRSTLSCWRRIRISATSFVLGLKSEAMIWRMSRRNSIIKWQGYRVSAWRLAESYFRYTQVYKVDRLTRSLADFAKLVELFDDHDVSFVSVTQQFNTTTSMGRLTLNVLLSFAQFEREVTSERIRDKIAASKRKGLWVGGM